MTVVETSSGRRGVRDILAGRSMVKPREPMALEGEIIDPRTSRLAVNHPAVHANPERFDACDPKDATTLRYLGRELERILRIRRQTRAGTSRGGAPLHNNKLTRSREAWRLPGRVR